MKAYAEFEATARNIGCKSETKKIIKNGFVPGVIYIKGKNSIPMSLVFRDVNSIANDPSAFTRIYSISLDGKKYNCVLKEVQFDAANDTPRHIDFMEVKAGDKINVVVPIKIINKEICPGVKNGGDIYVLSYNVKIKCEVEKIPYAIEIDVKDNVIGDKYFLRDIKLPEGCKMIKDIILIRVAGKRVIKEAETATATEGAEATATAEGAATATPATATADASKPAEATK